MLPPINSAADGGVSSASGVACCPSWEAPPVCRLGHGRADSEGAFRLGTATSAISDLSTHAAAMVLGTGGAQGDPAATMHRPRARTRTHVRDSFAKALSTSTWMTRAGGTSRSTTRPPGRSRSMSRARPATWQAGRQTSRESLLSPQPVAGGVGSTLDASHRFTRKAEATPLAHGPPAEGRTLRLAPRRLLARPEQPDRAGGHPGAVIRAVARRVATLNVLQSR